MNKSIVISQPMFFPWSGFYELIMSGDCFVNYDDAQFTKGGFINRVQMKTQSGIQWLTVPVKYKSGMLISETPINHSENWSDKHYKTILQNLNGLPFLQDLMDIINTIYKSKYETIEQLSMESLIQTCKYLEIDFNVIKSSEVKSSGTSSNKVLSLVKELGGTRYITAHGAKNYLDFEAFERSKIDLQFINYSKTIYPQKYGDFTPYVTILDLIANVGKRAKEYLSSETVEYKEFMKNA
jgi:WbqC-like protein family